MMDDQKNGVETNASIDGAGVKPDKLIEKIFKVPSECAFNKEQKAVCSPRHVVDKMAHFLKEKDGIDVKDPVKVVQNIKERMNCNSESCVIKSPEFINFAKLTHVDKVLDEFFKPSGPATHFGLLSNYNIDRVLDQLEERFPGFLHIPFQMRDFEKVGTELARVDLAKKYREGYKTFGVVLNTDWSDGNGIHWYCLFGEMKKDRIQIEYFNSSGKEPLPETQAWLQKTKHYLTRELKIPVDIKYSTGIRFQDDEHSCGVYCLMYIWLRLEGVSANWFRSENFNDPLMHRARRVLFRHEV